MDDADDPSPTASGSLALHKLDNRLPLIFGHGPKLFKKRRIVHIRGILVSVLSAACAFVLRFYPSPAVDETEPDRINLYSLLVEHPDETYVLKASGESMINGGINPDDMLVVDHKKPATYGAIVIASINGEFTVKRLEHKKGQPFLMPENPNFKPIPVGDKDEVHIFGVVTHSIHVIK